MFRGEQVKDLFMSLLLKRLNAIMNTILHFRSDGTMEVKAVAHLFLGLLVLKK